MSETLTRPERHRTSLREIDGHTRRRRARGRIARATLTLGMVVAVVPLALILLEVTRRGLPALDWEFLTSIQPGARRPGGGYVHGLIGSAYMVTFATLFSVPVGILAAVYLVEYGKGPLAGVIRFFTDVMTGVPSVFVGLFIYALLVRGGLGFGAITGAAGLAVLMLPIIVRSSEEMLKLVPEDQRAASIGLGARKWQTILRVVLPSAAPGLVTGSMLAVARAAGETAVLLLTALGSLQIVSQLQGTPIASLTLLIYRGARQPFEAGQQRAWAGALLLMIIVLVLTLAARLVSARWGRR
ncbi:phosphate ABC transporter permease PstA [Egicoccus sp. AB-alg2]|uniref:phosphate ABC transporter permease PstA n=1 Tax=Egicoccus sp. AB-alg2 TaxID=3242693 RepID=UPI00359D5960